MQMICSPLLPDSSPTGVSYRKSLHDVNANTAQAAIIIFFIFLFVVV